MTTRAKAVKAVLNAWREPGPRPDVHVAAKRRLAQEWPTLYRALVALNEKEPR